MTTRGVIASFVAVVAILGSILVGIGPATASSRFAVTVNTTRLVSGHVLVVTARSNVTCDWAIRWAGKTRLKRNTRSLVARFVAPRVTKARKYPLLALCAFRAPVVSGTSPPRSPRNTPRRVASTIEVVVPPHWFKAITITVVPPAPLSKPSTAPGLPDTGGPMGSLVVLALGLLLTGTALVRVSRRTPPPRAAGCLGAAGSR